ncbi:MAG: AGE family epimerase/isomerase, partial [Pseudomonadota bacterium]
FKDRNGAGYWRFGSADPARYQNPHMHLFEAFLALRNAHFCHELDQYAEQKIVELSDLFFFAIYDSKKNVVREVLDRDWRRVVSAEGRRVEPGHCFEWSWLLLAANRLVRHEALNAAIALCNFAEARGVNPVTGLVYNTVDEDGFLIDGRHRLWPHTERIRTLSAGARFQNAPNEAAFEAAFEAELVLSRYFFETASRCCWTERLDDAGRAIAAETPASSLYHLFACYAERLEACAPSELSS